jgi:hypothetical protein
MFITPTGDASKLRAPAKTPAVAALIPAPDHTHADRCAGVEGSSRSVVQGGVKARFDRQVTNKSIEDIRE